MARIRDLSVGRRLGSSFLVVGLLIVASSGAGLWGQSRERDIQTRVERLERVMDDIRQARFQAADVVGWQGMVAADAGAFGGAYATSPTGYNREGELESKQNLYESLGTAHTTDMTPAERTAFAELRRAWDDFFRWDDEAMALFRRNTQGARAKAVKSINGGEAAAAYRDALDITDQLETSVSRRMAALRAEQASVASTSRGVLLGALIGALLLASVLSTMVTRSVVRPLAVVVDALGHVAEGDLTVRTGLDSADELGRLGRTLDRTTESLRATIRTLGEHAGVLAESSGAMSEVSLRIASSAEESSTQANVVAAASERVSENVQTAAAGAEQMTASIREISRSSQEAASVAAEAVSVAGMTNMTVAKLGESSIEIGNVVKLITSIAEQTNLLALNATIESARAGEMGRGFAIVASEVKELAQETAKATEDISNRVQAIQVDTAAAVSAIEQIGDIIERINGIQTAIACTIEEQTATTNEMGRNVVEAASGSKEISATIGYVAQTATLASAEVATSKAAASELARMSTELRGLITRFRT